MLLTVLFLVVSTTSALPRLVKRDSTPLFYELPSNSSLVLGQIRNGFDCANRPYGYYADQSNNCAIFHVCYPYVDAEGNSVTRMFSFLCGQGSIFDQSTLTCNFPELALPCEAAATYYNINEYFGRENVQFRDGSINGIF